MKLFFTKMHGCGNDYIYFDAFTQHIPDPEALSRRLSDRHFGVGGDGVVLIGPSAIADARMRMFNADGSEGNMCGNAIRCVGKYLYDHGMVQAQSLTIETRSGVKNLQLKIKAGRVDAVRVDMGKPELRPQYIPVLLPGDRVIGRTVELGGQRRTISCVSMGNPHCVIFCPQVDDLDLPAIGPLCENDPLFPDRVNTEFVEVCGPQRLKMRVWERGSGETWACGTGACASAVAAVESGVSPRNQPIELVLRGGVLTITVTDETVLMEGGASEVFKGEVEV